MHHYPFHIGDYARETAHLEPLEDLAYRRLLDLYYSTEQPISLETQMVSRKIRMETQVVIVVLKEFFKETEKGWVHTRCQYEINNYHAIVERNRLNGKLGGRPKKTQSDNSGNPDVTQTKANQEPRTYNQEPITKENLSVGRPPLGEGFETFWKAYPKKVGKGAAEKAWLKARVNGELRNVLEAVGRQAKSEQWLKDGGQFIPNPATWIGQKRWLDGESVEIATHAPVKLCCECHKNPVSVNTRGGICHVCL